MDRVKSVLLVDCPSELADLLAVRIGPAGWICARVASLGEAEKVLHEVRPAIVLVGSRESATRAQAVCHLRADPLVAGVPVLGMAGGRPAADATWIGADTDGVRAGPAREVFAALEALLATTPS